MTLPQEGAGGTFHGPHRRRERGHLRRSGLPGWCMRYRAWAVCRCEGEGTEDLGHPFSKLVCLLICLSRLLFPRASDEDRVGPTGVFAVRAAGTLCPVAATHMKFVPSVWAPRTYRHWCTRITCCREVVSRARRLFVPKWTSLLTILDPVVWSNDTPSCTAWMWGVDNPRSPRDGTAPK